jgi:hypothetical protein
MTTGRVLLIIGALTSAAGAAGLVAWGSSPVEVFGILTIRVTAEGITPLPYAFDNYLPAVCCAILFVAGQVAGCAALRLPNRQHSLASPGRILMVLSALGIFLAALVIAKGLLDMTAAFEVIATSPIAPKAEELQAATGPASTLITTGYAILLIASCAPLLAAVVGYQNRAGEHRLTVMRHLPTPIAAVAGICYIAFWIMSSNHATALKDTITTNPKPKDLAAHLGTILTASLFGCLMLIFVAAALSAAAYLAPGQNQRVRELSQPDS